MKRRRSSFGTSRASKNRAVFDRMLVAQAQAEGLSIVTADSRIPLYGVRTIAA